MLLAIWNCINVPYSLAFSEGESLELFLVNMLIDILFMTDIIINFRTTYINEETGIETFSCKEITIEYLKGKSVLY